MSQVARISLFLAVLVLAEPVSAFNTYAVGTPVDAREHNDVLDRWLDRKIALWVGADESGSEYLFFTVDTGLGDATARFRYTPELSRELTELVEKSIRWAEVARLNSADTTKPLGCFGGDRYDLY